MKTLFFLSSLLATLPCLGAEIEYTYGVHDIVIASEKVENDKCEVASCGAYAYYASVKSLEKAIEKACKDREFRKHVIVGTERSSPSAENLVLTMTGICKR